ncbi:hypothetical protein MKZ38_001268 [Zalerion maritima]|uniref:2-dehydropantoate 2-reductase n=1 Tax=Zalerion maritima TaxID=339359 RepID=A0AAD5RS10_9PEZI|nr:hypothetical protein MKZ38_001268 [Zalerion maritima]
MAVDMVENELMNVCVVGGNPVSAFLSWRLQATNACDVTLVWKSGYDHVAQYGLTFKSPIFGNERFKPRHVVKTPEDAANMKEGAFDYVIVCVKALPDIYDLATVIDSVVTPQHTCILINTTHALGVESPIEERFPTNVVISLVSGAEVFQLGQSEFEHKGSTSLWVGPANKDQNIPPQIQDDMAQALAMTLCTGQVDCKVSSNIRQQQYERVIGPIAFHPASVIFEAPSHSALIEKVGVSQLVSDVIDELINLATAQGCKFSPDFKQKTIDEMTQPTPSDSIMYQDYVARRPMEVETYLGSPIKLAQSVGIKVPRIETLYTIFFNLNQVNRTRPKDGTASGSPSTQSPLPPRLSSQPGPRSVSNGIPNGIPNGNGMGPRPRPRGPPIIGPMPPGGRRPPMNGRPSMNGPPNGYYPPSSRQASRRGSLEGADLEEFSHLVVYDDIPEAGESEYGGSAGHPDMALRERELQLRQRELALREREIGMGRRPIPGSRRGPPPPPSQRGGGAAFDDEDDDEDYFDPTVAPPTPMIDPDNFDMMSVTSRKNRKGPSPAQFRKNPEAMDAVPAQRTSRFRPNFGRNRSSQVMAMQSMQSMPGLHENILDDPLMGYSSNRYGAVDRGTMHAESRANSLTAARLDEMQLGPGGPVGPAGPPGPPGPMNGPFPRRTSQSPGNMYSPSIRGGRPSPPNGYGPQMNGRPSPPDGVRQPVPRYPPGQGNSVAPQQVEQHVGVSLHQPKMKSVRSLTGSASASAGSGESSRIDSENSAHSSQSSLGPRPPIGVR